MKPRLNTFCLKNCENLALISTPVQFKVLWFQNEATYLKSKKDWERRW